MRSGYGTIKMEGLGIVSPNSSIFSRSLARRDDRSLVISFHAFKGCDLLSFELVFFAIVGGGGLP